MNFFGTITTYCLTWIFSGLMAKRLALEVLFICCILDFLLINYVAFNSYFNQALVQKTICYFFICKLNYYWLIAFAFIYSIQSTNFGNLFYSIFFAYKYFDIIFDFSHIIFNDFLHFDSMNLNRIGNASIKLRFCVKVCYLVFVYASNSGFFNRLKKQEKTIFFCIHLFELDWWCNLLYVKARL